MRSPGGENEGGSLAANNNDIKIENEESSNLKEEGKEKKTVIDKVRDALKDWANDDKRDQEFDDTRP